jgi:hypothetical protein
VGLFIYKVLPVVGFYKNLYDFGCLTAATFIRHRAITPVTDRNYKYIPVNGRFCPLTYVNRKY